MNHNQLSNTRFISIFCSSLVPLVVNLTNIEKVQFYCLFAEVYLSRKLIQICVHNRRGSLQTIRAISKIVEVQLRSVCSGLFWTIGSKIDAQKHISKQLSCLVRHFPGQARVRCSSERYEIHMISNFRPEFCRIILHLNSPIVGVLRYLVYVIPFIR